MARFVLPIGLRFYEGSVLLEVVEDANEELVCSACYFNKDMGDCLNNAYCCAADYRYDGKNVYYKKLEQ